jgi:alpha-L-rhamnosidase
MLFSYSTDSPTDLSGLTDRTGMSVQISRVTVEHYPIALGIAESAPRLSWRFSGTSSNWAQKSYDVRLHRSSGTEEFHIDSEQSVLVPWPGKPLGFRESVKAEVRSNGQDGSSTEWADVNLEKGLEAGSHTWRLISGEAPNHGEDKSQRPFRLRKVFQSDSTTKGRLYITAQGVYEVYVNGEKVSPDLLAPGWTDYRYHLNLQTYDVSAHLQKGENVISAWIGDGWFCGRLGFHGGRRSLYGDRIGLMANLEVDGKQVVSTDDSWQWSYGSIVSSELYDGEVYDSSLEEPDWQTIKYEPSQDWKPVEVLPAPKGEIVISQAPPVKEIMVLPAKEIITTPSGKTIIDFGQNFAGVLRFKSDVPSSSGTLTLRHAEVLEKGELGVRPLRDCKATDIIHLSKTSIKGYQPKFTFHGFRYAEVTGWDSLSLSDIEGVVMQTAMERTGSFECSHSLINQLHSNVVWSTIGNTISVPTDCPQRDERLGWTGDIQVITPTLNFLFDASGFMNGWMKDAYVDQKENKGIVPVVVPNMFAGPKFNAADVDQIHQAHAIWGDVAVITPEALHTAFDDKEALKVQLDGAKLWLDKGVRRDEKTRLWARDQFQLADWLAPKADPTVPGIGPTDNYLVADAYLIYTTRVCAKICTTLGEDAEAKRYNDEADQLTTLFYHEYVSPSGRVVSDTQTALALLLHFDIFPSTANASELKQAMGKRLGELVTRDLWQVSTGFAGTPIVLQTLADNGQLHHAYRMLQARDCPSWLSPVLLGATTIWERWDSMLANGDINPGDMTSFNHYALGSVAYFLHAYIGGIRPLEAGWKKVLIKPQPGGTITHAKVAHTSPYGEVKCQWEIKDGKLKVEVSVPPNATAKVELPGLEEEIRSGERSFEVDWKKDERFPPKPVQPGFCATLPDNWVP